MSDTKELLERAWRLAHQPEDVMDSLIRRRARKERNRRIATGVLAIVVALVSLAALIRTFRTVERPADEPTPVPKPEGIFAEVAGWIAYGNESVKQGPLGIWTVDPTRPNDPEARIQLSERPGEPLAWSSDGSKLLIVRTRDQEDKAWPPRQGLFVLNADGTETRVVTNAVNVGGEPLNYFFGGSFSPDASQVVFATYGREPVNGIYTVDADGGTPRLILAVPSVLNPAFSPDGTQIAYLTYYSQRPSLRVVNADGTGDRVLHDVCDPSQRAGGPAWSPDGTHIAYSCELSIWVVSADGSGIARTVRGRNPYWSPDGLRIAFKLHTAFQGKLAIANADGSHIQVFGYPAQAGPWNPLLLSASGKGNRTATTSSGLTAPLGYAVVALGVLALLVLAWRARRITARIPRAR
jgi:Tol biopolymer transport system component